MGAIMDKIKGKLMKTEGRATGDKVRSAQGTVTDKKGDAKLAASAVKSKGRELKARAKAATARTKARSR